ncbi:MAG TPA: hypothetical protein VK464_07770 [Symbiobacteriaceae bacterium]|nr:hypothetical protein [Symbiobacteriaceae bacterium]
MDPFPGERQVNWASDAQLVQRCSNCGALCEVNLNVVATLKQRPTT